MMDRCVLAGMIRSWRSGKNAAAGVLVCLLAAALLAGCAQAPAAQPTQIQPEAVAASPTPEPATPTPEATELPSPTPTLPPTATPEPTATPLPTATPVPPLAVLEDGFDAWCAPLEYAGTRPEGPVAPDYARKLVVEPELLKVPIPAVYCVVSYRFNQPAPDGLKLSVYDGNSPFLEAPLDSTDGQPDTAWTSLSHSYIVNPPLWEVTYRLAVTGPDGAELWSNPVKFAKPLPEPCLFGGLPDPVTLWCTKTDPWEIEPWPDVEYPYDRSRLTPDP